MFEVEEQLREHIPSTVAEQFNTEIVLELTSWGGSQSLKIFLSP